MLGDLHAVMVRTSLRSLVAAEATDDINEEALRERRQKIDKVIAKARKTYPYELPTSCAPSCWSCALAPWTSDRLSFGVL
jgi:hypothetical protein